MNNKHPSHAAILTHHTLHDIQEKLAPLISAQRLARIEAVLQHRLGGIQVALEHPANIDNAFATFRSTEALGLSMVHLIAAEYDCAHLRTITQGAHFWLDIRTHVDLQVFLAMPNRPMLAAAVPGRGCPLSELPIERDLCIVLGNECRGLSDAAIAVADYHYHIPMYGMSESLNLSVSTAISLFDLTRRKRRSIGKKSDLSCEQYQALKAQYLLNSVDPRWLPTLFPGVANVADH